MRVRINPGARESPREANDAAFGGRVGSPPYGTTLERARAGQHNGGLCRGIAQLTECDAGVVCVCEIARNGSIPYSVIVMQWVFLEDARHVDQRVQRAASLLECIATRRWRRHVRYGEAGCAVNRERFACSAKPIFVHVHQMHTCTSAQEKLCTGHADASSAAGHDDAAPCEFTH